MRKALLGALGILLLVSSSAVAQTESTTQVTISLPRISFQRSGVGRAENVAQAPMPTPVAADEAPPVPVPDGGIMGGFGPREVAGRFYIEADYLHWFVKPMLIPVPLLTTDKSGGAAGPNPGLDSEVTQVLVGNERVTYRDGFPGLRLLGGYAWDETFGLEIGVFALGERSLKTYIASDAIGQPNLFRPFFNLTTNDVNGGIFIAFPGQATGSFGMENTLELWGFDANVVAHLADDGVLRLDMTTGFKHLVLDENLRISDKYTNIPPNGGPPFGPFFGGVPLVIGDSVATFDSFHTRNEFNGAQLGFLAELRLGGLVLMSKANIALGDTTEIVSIAGGSTLTKGGTGLQTSLPGGTLALPSNIGRVSHDRFSVIPEVNLKLAYDFTQNLRAFIGYDFLNWTYVARPGDQISLFQNDPQSPQSPRFGAPGFSANPAPPGTTAGHASFWAQGVSVGLNFRF